MIRRLTPVILFCVLVSLTALGVCEILRQAEMNLVLTRLPETPSLGRNSQALAQKITKADAEVRARLAKQGPDQAFGRAAGNLGRLYQANQFYDQALSSYRLALEHDDQSAKWPYLTASIHQQRGEAASMAGFLEQTLLLAEGYTPGFLKLADTYFKADEIGKAKINYEHRLDLVPGDPYALMGLARIALDAGRWDIAETRLKQAISSDPKFGDAHRLMAQVHEHYGRMKDKQNSLALAADCIRFRPAPDPWIDDLKDLCYDPRQLLVLSSMALAELDMETAIKKHLARALEIDPQNPAVHLALGQAWLMAGDWSRAHQYLSRAIELNPASDQAYFQLGLILQNQNKLPQAEAMMRKALTYQPNNANVQNNLGVILMGRQRFEEAIAAFNKALEIYPEHFNARYNLGLCLWASGNSRGAAKEYRQVLEIKPGWDMAANSLAWILATDKDQDLRDGRRALKWAEIALQGRHRNNPEYLDTLAAAQAQSGQFQAAVQVARRAIGLAEAAGDEAMARDIKARLKLYQAKTPFRQ